MDGSADLESIITTATEIARSGFGIRPKSKLWQSAADLQMLICI